jgi:hypothetical protein
MEKDILTSPLFRRPDIVRDPLYVVAILFNATRWRARWKLYQRFRHHMMLSGVKLITVELAFGNRDFALTADMNGWHDGEYNLRLRTDDEIWFKENLINLGVSRLPSDWKYMAWIDADVMFSKPDWADGVVQALQHYQWIQPWSQTLDLDPNHEMLATHEAFFHSYQQGFTLPENSHGYYYPMGKPSSKIHRWHPGYAGACRRVAFDAVGGMIDWAVLGAGDNHMAHALIGQAERTLPPNIHPNYRKWILEWQERAENSVKRNVGVQRGLLVHYFHGHKVNRKYWDRWKILVKHQFDPDTHLQRDWQGLWQLSHKAPIGLRDDIRSYFRQRSEDEGFGGDPA